MAAVALVACDNDVDAPYGIPGTDANPLGTHIKGGTGAGTIEDPYNVISILNVASQLEGDPYFDGDKAQRLLQQALTTLPDKQRLVFNLRYFDELTYTEISEIIGSTVGALKADYHLAVKKISKFFEEQD